MDTNDGRHVINNTESDARGYCRSFDTVFASASGAILTDTDGCEYIDFLAACGSLNYGHNDPDMSRALINHIETSGLSAGLDLYSTPKARFIESFKRLILDPRQLNYRVQFTGPTGTNAVEAALKLARKVTGRNTVMSFTNGFHGVTLGALAATGNKYNRMGEALHGVSRVPFDGYYGDDIDTTVMIEKLITDPSSGVETPAAFILETVQGEGGLNCASAAWLQKLAAIAQRHGILLIVDDIQAGCGRTGSFFSFETLGITPDMVTLSKSISGYGLPMALVLIKPELDQWQPAEHNGTFRGNTHAFVTAQVTLEKYWSNNVFQQQISGNGEIVRSHLQDLIDLIPNARLKGRGMMNGIDVGCGQLASKITKQCFAHGLVIETSGPYDEVVKVLAPLNTPETTLVNGLEILQRSVRQVTGKRPSVSPIKVDLDTQRNDVALASAINL
ncbi:diaminobutyrate--2-oxoglutarate transaminase [Halioxenophilus aromaticivorans]|uniref:Diaminobutyrate--2-oxoglutarate transaminase n=1 Tax=Halioxenophilus aromaticivorans TaxID=1306992 RepID=A0AAV3U1K2_9ALTE